MDENVEKARDLELLELKIKRTIAKIRPYIQRDGGDVEFSRYENGIVWVNMHGACLGCSILDSTLKDGIEALLKDEVEGVTEVRLEGADDLTALFGNAY